jgi:copper chaperone CopZ
MPKLKSFYYIVDALTEEKAPILRRALEVVPGIETVRVSVGRGMVEIQAKKSMPEQVKLACEVAGARYRTEGTS